MATTLPYTAIVDAWTQVSNGESSVAIQLATNGEVEVHVGDVAPGEDSVGIIIASSFKSVPNSFSVSGLLVSTNVWIRSANNDAVKAVVLAYGSP